MIHTLAVSCSAACPGATAVGASGKPAACAAYSWAASRRADHSLPLFDYSEFTRCWHINYQHYPDAEAALAWLQEDGPDLTEWRAIVDHYRAEATTRMQHKRSTAP
jgi:hypothetical protein